MPAAFCHENMTSSLLPSTCRLPWAWTPYYMLQNHHLKCTRWHGSVGRAHRSHRRGKREKRQPSGLSCEAGSDSSLLARKGERSPPQGLRATIERTDCWFESNCHHQAQALVDQGLASFCPFPFSCTLGYTTVAYAECSLTKVPYCIVAFVVDSVWLFSRNRSAFSACVCVNGVVAGRNNGYLIGSFRLLEISINRKIPVRCRIS